MGDVLSTVHPVIAWLVTIVGGLCVGLLAAAARRRAPDPWALVALRVFAGLMTLQVALGAGAALVAEPAVAFAGDQDKLLWHAVLGGTGLLLAVLAVWSARLPQRAVLTTVLAAAAVVAPNLGRLGLVLLSVVAGLVIGTVAARRAPATTHP